MSAVQLDHRRACRHLRRSDPVLNRVISAVGPCKLQPRRDRFAALVRAILGQQVSSAAAATIYRRLQDAVRPSAITSASLLRLDAAQLAATGVSRQKASYLLDLAQRTADRRLRLGQLARLDDEQVIGQLVQVRGIGRWTAEMFLIFVLGRPDVLPVDDLGIRDSVRQAYGLRQLPTADRLQQIAAPWRPHASVACWYLWQLRHPPQLRRRP